MAKSALEAARLAFVAEGAGHAAAASGHYIQLQTEGFEYLLPLAALNWARWFFGAVGKSLKPVSATDLTVAKSPCGEACKNSCKKHLGQRAVRCLRYSSFENTGSWRGLCPPAAAILREGIERLGVLRGDFLNARKKPCTMQGFAVGDGAHSSG